MKQLLLLTDSGHGGLVVRRDGRLYYTTGRKKRYLHKNGSIALEGVINRQVEAELLRLWDGDSRPWVDVSSGNLDLPKNIRVDLANSIYEKYKKKYNSLFLSLHSNAGKGTGIEIITSPGQTKSDEYADIWIDELELEFPEFKFRKNWADGDADKEMRLYVLLRTKMPALLGEFLFFDNWLDWQQLQKKDVIQRYAYATYKFLCKSERDLQ